MTAPRRRWSFTLRTLFVAVTELCCWLGWQLHIVRERNAVKEMLRERNVGLDGLPSTVANASPPKISWDRQLLGDSTTAQIYVNGNAFSKDEVRRIRAAFPETTISVVTATQADRP